MVGNCDGEGRRVQIVLSFGLVALAVFAALCVVVGERVAPRIEQQLGIRQQAEPVTGGISYDTLKNAPLNQMPINETASREVKKQSDCAACMLAQVASPAKPPTPAPTSTPVVSTPTARKYSVAVFVGTDPQSQTLLDWWNRDRQLRFLREDCNFQVYTKDNALYRERFATAIPVDEFPAVLFTDPDGGHVYVAGRQFLPDTGPKLFAEMKAAYETQRQLQQQVESPGTPEISIDPNCPDGNCRPSDRDPFPDRDRKPLFPFLHPQPDNTVESLLYWLWNPGEAVLALLCVAVFAVLVLVVSLKVFRS